MELCECGCGEEVSKFGNRFIHGHNERNKHHSKDTKEKIGSSLQKYFEDFEACEKNSAVQKKFHKEHPGFWKEVHGRPEVIARRIEAKNHPRVKAKKRVPLSEEHKAKLRKHWFWGILTIIWLSVFF